MTFFILRRFRKVTDSAATEVPEQSDTTLSRLDRTAIYLLLGVVFLLPIFFIPSLSVPFQFTKTVLVGAATLIAAILFLIARLSEARLSIPLNVIVGAVWLVPLAYLISSVFSSNIRQSLVGDQFEIDTFGFTALAAVLTTLVVLLFRTREHTLHLYLILFLSFVVLAVYQALRLIFGADFLTFGVFNATTSNLLGKWNDLGIFFGLFAVLSFVTLIGLRLASLFKYLLYVFLVISLFFLGIINFTAIWVVLGLFALGFFIYSFFTGRFREEHAVSLEPSGSLDMRRRMGRVSIASIIVLLVSVSFLVGGDSLSSYLADQFSISQIEARPSWQSTVAIARDTYESNAFFGSGPNTFAEQWEKFKPAIVNETPFWQTTFSFGIGTIPTAFITAGLIGGIAWLFLLGALLWLGVRRLILSPVSDPYSYYLSLSSFLAAAYLWIFSVLYTPNVVIITLAFIFTGIFVASLRHHPGGLRLLHLDGARNPRTGFVSVLAMTVLMVVAALSIYTLGQRYAAAVYFQHGVVLANVEGNLARAEESLSRAVTLSENDRQHRRLAEISIVRLNALIQNQSLPPDELRERFRSTLAQAIENTQRATELDGVDHRNWFILGQVYHTVTPLNIEGSYEQAKRAYDEAQRYAPANPAVVLMRARLELARGNTAAAQPLVDEALSRKRNYTEAIFLRTQFLLNEGNIAEAINSVEQAALLDPRNPAVHFQLGFLRYNNEDYQGAIAALERAVALNNNYANARYFLGLAHYQEGRTNEAIVQFERVAALNPDNDEVAQILENLRAGESPFADGELPAPEERGELPVEETTIEEEQ